MRRAELLSALSNWISIQNTDVTGYVRDEDWRVVHTSDVSVVIERKKDGQKYRLTAEELDPPDPEKAA